MHEGTRAELDARQQAIGRMVAPIQESLGRFDAAIQGIEKERLEAYSVLREQVRSLRDGQTQLHAETASLVKALRSPATRGRWGEIQLRRVVELAGMIENCDFVEQGSVDGEDGRLRPDLVVRLPGDKTLVVDAKVPLGAYLEAIEAGDEGERRRQSREHARQVRSHIVQLASKSYWSQFQASPDFVVMFIPLESGISTALQEDPSLFEYAVDHKVLLAGPMTLIAHLRSAAHGWRQERIAANAQQISDLGRLLYDRIQTLADHFGAVGRNLDKAVRSYNEAVGSFEHRVLVPARRFRELGVAGRPQEADLHVVDRTPRLMRVGSGPAVADVLPLGAVAGREGEA